MLIERDKRMKIINRTYHRNYESLESLEAGIALIGAEVKSVRAGAMRLETAFVKIIGTEVFLVNAEIPIYQYSRPQGYDSKRTRKLLLHKKEITRLRTKLAASNRLTLAPISCYNKRKRFKIQIALSRGRQEIEKKKLVKSRDEKLREKREAKEYMKV